MNLFEPCDWEVSIVAGGEEEGDDGEDGVFSVRVDVQEKRGAVSWYCCEFTLQDLRQYGLPDDVPLATVINYLQALQAPHPPVDAHYTFQKNRLVIVLNFPWQETFGEDDVGDDTAETKSTERVGRVAEVTLLLPRRKRTIDEWKQMAMAERMQRLLAEDREEQHRMEVREIIDALKEHGLSPRQLRMRTGRGSRGPSRGGSRGGSRSSRGGSKKATRKRKSNEDDELYFPPGARKSRSQPTRGYEKQDEQFKSLGLPPLGSLGVGASTRTPRRNRKQIMPDLSENLLEKGMRKNSLRLEAERQAALQLRKDQRKRTKRNDGVKNTLDAILDT